MVTRSSTTSETLPSWARSCSTSYMVLLGPQYPAIARMLLSYAAVIRDLPACVVGRFTHRLLPRKFPFNAGQT